LYTIDIQAILQGINAAQNIEVLNNRKLSKIDPTQLLVEFQAWTLEPFSKNINFLEFSAVIGR
jgi:hypothetical protein